MSLNPQHGAHTQRTLQVKNQRKMPPNQSALKMGLAQKRWCKVGRFGRRRRHLPGENGVIIVLVARADMVIVAKKR